MAAFQIKLAKLNDQAKQIPVDQKVVIKTTVPKLPIAQPKVSEKSKTIKKTLIIKPK